MKQGLALVGRWRFVVYDCSGLVKATREFRNKITFGGFDLLCDLLGAVTRPEPIQVIGIGWGAGSYTEFSATHQDLQGANRARTSASYFHNVGSKRATFTASWGAGTPDAANTIIVQEAALFTALTGGVMFNRVTGPTLATKEVADTLEVTCDVDFSEVA